MAPKPATRQAEHPMPHMTDANLADLAGFQLEPSALPRGMAITVRLRGQHDRAELAPVQMPWDFRR